MPGTQARSARLLVGASWLAYFAGFAWNVWGAARSERFEAFQRGSECHVLGRLVKSRQDGVFSAGGLLGVGAVRFEPGTALSSGVRFRRAEVESGLHLRGEEQEWPAGAQ